MNPKTQLCLVKFSGIRKLATRNPNATPTGAETLSKVVPIDLYKTKLKLSLRLQGKLNAYVFWRNLNGGDLLWRV